MNLVWDSADRVLIAGNENHLEPLGRDAIDHIKGFIVTLKLLLLLICLAAIALAGFWLMLGAGPLDVGKFVVGNGRVGARSVATLLSDAIRSARYHALLPFCSQ